MASCGGSCTAQANLNCDVMCQSSGYASCEASLTGGYMAQCSQPQGALYCSGQYVDVGNNLQNCLDELKSALNITASASGSCSGNTCMAQASVSACSAPGALAAHTGAGGLLAVGAGLGCIAFARRRRRG
jgi:hypothetical protein